MVITNQVTVAMTARVTTTVIVTVTVTVTKRVTFYDTTIALVVVTVTLTWANSAIQIVSQSWGAPPETLLNSNYDAFEGVRGDRK